MTETTELSGSVSSAEGTREPPVRATARLVGWPWRTSLVVLAVVRCWICWCLSAAAAPSGRWCSSFSPSSRLLPFEAYAETRACYRCWSGVRAVARRKRRSGDRHCGGRAGRPPTSGWRKALAGVCPRRVLPTSGRHGRARTARATSAAMTGLSPRPSSSDDARSPWRGRARGVRRPTPRRCSRLGRASRCGLAHVAAIDGGCASFVRPGRW